MSLPPLAWLMHEDVLVTSGDTIHRPGCISEPAEPLFDGQVLWRVRAPALCSRCRPDVELQLTRPA